MTAQAIELVREHLDRIQATDELDAVQREAYRRRIKELLQARNAVLVAHYYTDPEIQALAEATGGCVADSVQLFCELLNLFVDRAAVGICVDVICCLNGEFAHSL